MGRPSALTPEVQESVVQAIRLGATRELAAGYAGVHVGTLYAWLKKGREAKSGRYHEFAEAVKGAEGRGCVELLARIHAAAREGKWQAAAWILERRHGYRRYSGPEDLLADADDTPETSTSSTDESDAVSALKRTLQDTRRLRLRAEQSGSFVAAANLLKHEAALAERLTALDPRHNRPDVEGQAEAERALAEEVHDLPEHERLELVELMMTPEEKAAFRRARGAGWTPETPQA